MSSVDKQIPSYVRFAIAGLAGGGGALTSHPFDLVKYRMQLSGKGGAERLYKNSLHAVYKITTTEGIYAIYSGLTASILRQITITTVRFGLYSAVVDHQTATDGTPPSLFLQISAGAVAGGLAAIVGNPFDVVLTRMASEGALPPEQRREYKNCFHALATIYREDALAGLFIGWRPAFYRMMILNVTQIVLYKNTKVLLLKTDHFEDTTLLHIICSIASAFTASVATCPFDIVKTRLMTLKDVEGEPEYKSMIAAWRKIISEEGFLSLWKGLTPTFGRILPHNFTVFILLELFTKTYKKLVLGDKSGTGF